MKNQLPQWANNPIIVLGFAAICLGVPVLVGISDRAAAFAGGLTSGLAAVIAVVVGGLINRENDRARDRRQRHRDLSAIGTEISLRVELSIVAYRQMHPPLRKFYVEADPRRVRPRFGGGITPTPAEPIFSDMLCGFLMAYTEPLPDRVISKIGHFPRSIATSLSNYIVVNGYIRETLAAISARKDAIGGQATFLNWPDCKALTGHLEDAIRFGDALDAQLVDFLNTLEVD